MTTRSTNTRSKSRRRRWEHYANFQAGTRTAYRLVTPKFIVWLVPVDHSGHPYFRIDCIDLGFSERIETIAPSAAKRDAIRAVRRRIREIVKSSRALVGVNCRD